MSMYPAYIASLLIGLLLGLIGAGGSILTVPVFVYILKTDPIAASVYSMFVVGTCSMVGSIKSFIKKTVSLKTVLLFGLPSVTGVFISRKLIFPAIPPVLFRTNDFTLTKEMLFMICLSIIMFVASAKMLKGRNENEQDKDSDKKIKLGLLFLQGLAVGIISGLLGIGGGFLIVPALYLYALLPMKKVIGTTLWIITINSLFGFLNSFNAIAIEWPLLIKFSAGAILGILIGTRLSTRIQADHLKKIFGYFIMILSVYILYKQYHG